MPDTTTVTDKAGNMSEPLVGSEICAKPSFVTCEACALRSSKPATSTDAAALVRLTMNSDLPPVLLTAKGTIAFGASDVAVMTSPRANRLNSSKTNEAGFGFMSPSSLPYQPSASFQAADPVMSALLANPTSARASNTAPSMLLMRSSGGAYEMLYSL